MYKGQKIAVVVPAYKEESQIEMVINTMPSFIDEIIIVDDASPDKTVEVVRACMTTNPRVSLVAREKNGGVGAAIESGYQAFIDGTNDVAVVMAGDGQMNPDDLTKILDPVVDDEADYSKANRLTLDYSWDDIPRIRLFGNMVLSLLNRFATGYWTIGDAQTGYTAANRRLVKAFVKRGMYPRYGVPNDLLITCALVSAVVIDVPTAPVYNVGEQSKLSPRKVMFPILGILVRGFFKRMVIRYLILEANPVPLAYLAGFISFFLGLFWSLAVAIEALGAKAQTTEVTAASILFVGGSILLVLAVVLDVLFSSMRNQRRPASHLDQNR
jgi:glycosyltransferase involved in cell wall biosynthesis